MSNRYAAYGVAALIVVSFVAIPLAVVRYAVCEVTRTK